MSTITRSGPEAARLLEAIDISPIEERVYRAMLLRPQSSLAELAKATDLVQRELRKVLTSLEQKGLASRSASKAVRFLPAPPEAALELLLLRKEEQLKRARVSISRLVEETRLPEPARRSAELVEIVIGRKAISQRLEQLVRSVEHEILAVDTPPYVTPTGTGQNALELELLERGIRNRAIYDPTALEVGGKLEQIREVVAAGEEARILNVPMRMLIADRAMALIPLGVTGAGLEEGDILIHPSPLLDALVLLFETLWDRAAPLRLDPGEQARATSEAGRRRAEDQQTLLALLAADAKDDVIAKHLGVSRRTVQRRIRDLMSKFGVATRTQLAVAAARKGLV